MTAATPRSGWRAQTRTMYAQTLAGVTVEFPRGKGDIESILVTHVDREGVIRELELDVEDVLLVASRATDPGKFDVTFVRHEESAEITLNEEPYEVRGFWKLTRKGDFKVFYIPKGQAVFLPPKTHNGKKHG